MNDIETIKLAAYIKKKYKELNNQEISPIKLQKSLYFLFAYWGQFIRLYNQNKNSVEINLSKYNEYLYDSKIEAWTYGAVIPVVYESEESNKINYKLSEKYLKNEKEKKEFIDDLLNQIFEVDDFGLVRIAHSDNCWKENYNENDEIHNKEIPKEDIINEYIKKEIGGI